jgi:hypothetical protein
VLSKRVIVVVWAALDASLVGAEGGFDACEVDKREGCDVRVGVAPGAVEAVAAVVADVFVFEFGEPIILVIVTVSEGGWFRELGSGSESSSPFSNC